MATEGVLAGPTGSGCGTGVAPPRFSPTPAAKMLPPASVASAVISFLGALYRTKASPAGEMR